MNARRAKREDIEQIKNIFTQHWEDDFINNLESKIENYFSIDTELISQYTEFLVVENNESKVIGVSFTRDAPEHMSIYSKTNNPVELYVLAVKEKGKGVGTFLVNEITKRARESGYTEMLLFSGEAHQESWNFHDSYAKRISEMNAPNGEKGFIWAKTFS